jgi:hypothetical protein
MSEIGIGQPLCATPEEAVEYITTELTRAAPAGWKVERHPDRRRESHRCLGASPLWNGCLSRRPHVHLQAQ